MNGGVEPDEMVPPGVPDQCRSCWLMLMSLNKHVGTMEHQVRTIENSAGKIRIPTAVWTLLWGIFLTVVTTTMWVGSTVTAVNLQMKQLMNDMDILHRSISAHVESAGHPVALERIKALEEQVDRERLDYLERGGRKSRKP